MARPRKKIKSQQSIGQLFREAASAGRLKITIKLPRFRLGAAVVSVAEEMLPLYNAAFPPFHALGGDLPLGAKNRDVVAELAAEIMHRIMSASDFLKTHGILYPEPAYRATLSNIDFERFASEMNQALGNPSFGIESRVPEISPEELSKCAAAFVIDRGIKLLTGLAKSAESETPPGLVNLVLAAQHCAVVEVCHHFTRHPEALKKMISDRARRASSHPRQKNRHVRVVAKADFEKWTGPTREWARQFANKYPCTLSTAEKWPSRYKWRRKT